jgi:hypothetical protein
MPGIAEARPPYVEYKRVAIEDRNASIAAGHRVVRNENRAYIMRIGSKDQVEKNAEDWLAQIKRHMLEGKYPEEWANFFQKKYDRWLENLETPPNGMPIAEWPSASPADVKNLRAAHVLTVEDLAQLSEQGLVTVGFGARELQQKAWAWLEAA